MATQTITSTAGPRIRTSLPGPKAQKILQGDAQYISPSYTRSYPLVAKRGRGAIVEDVDGNEFLDFTAGIAVVSTGHCHPEVVAAIQKQAGELIHDSRKFLCGRIYRLLRRRLRAPRRWRPFGHSGYDASLPSRMLSHSARRLRSIRLL